LPRIDDALTKGPLTTAEKRVFDVVENHTDHVWSDTLEDLCEVARWATYPELRNCPRLVSPDHSQLLAEPRILPGMTINDKVTCLSGGGKHPPEQKTYTLRTVANALDHLARTKRIWAFEIHGRKHYGSYRGKDQVMSRFEKLPQEQRDEAGFKEEFTFPDKNVNNGLA
jgi:hypothetical protein